MNTKVSYNSKEITLCPVCSEKFHREELHAGRGRLIVDSLTEQLRHTYKPSDQYGIVNPLLYPITVCPTCKYATLKEDFNKLKKEWVPLIERQRADREKDIRQLFPLINFAKKRSLPEGISSYYLALHCYNIYSPEFSPTFRQALCALRCAWLCNDLHKLQPQNNWEIMGKIFYRKCRYLYKLAIENDQNNIESLPDGMNYGPDTEKNYGTDGVLYLASLLEYYYGPRDNHHQRIENLQRAKIMLSKTFGIGQPSKLKPHTILENARNIHTKINQELGNMRKHSML